MYYTLQKSYAKRVRLLILVVRMYVFSDEVFYKNVLFWWRNTCLYKSISSIKNTTCIILCLFQLGLARSMLRLPLLFLLSYSIKSLNNIMRDNIPYSACDNHVNVLFHGNYPYILYIRHWGADSPASILFKLLCFLYFSWLKLWSFFCMTKRIIRF